MGKHRIRAGGAIAVGALLLAVPPAGAVTPTSCATLGADMNAATPGEVLQLPPGPCLTNSSVSNTNAFTVEGATTGGVTTLEPTDPSMPIIDAGSNNVTFTLSNLSFTGTTSNAAVFLGGAGQSTKFLSDKFYSNMYPSGFGAAISIQTFAPSTTAEPTIITGNTFVGNSAAGGGAITALGFSGSLVISHNKFVANSASNSGGGAVNITSNQPGTGAVQIADNIFGGPGHGVGNTSQSQGGALAVELNHTQTLTLASNLFQANELTGHTTRQLNAREGGAVYLARAFQQTAFRVNQSYNAFADNAIAETQSSTPSIYPIGGGAEWALGTTVNSVGDAFVDNRVAVNDGGPPEGGALGVFAVGTEGTAPPQGGVFTGSDDLFEGNSTARGGWGGAAYVGGPPPACTGPCPPSSLTLNDSTVIANHVDPGAGSEGGAIWGSPHDHLRLPNSIVYGNSPHPELFGFSATKPSIAYSDVCKESGGPAVPAHRGNICANPRLGPRGVETASSPTLDAGSNKLVPPGLTTDILGHPRIRSCGVAPPAIVDMGAYEFLGVGRIARCLDRTKPVVAIGDGPLKKTGGKTSVKLTCPLGQSYCDGTVTLKSASGTSVIGRHHFRIAGGHTDAVAVSLSGVGSKGSMQVLVEVSDRDAHGRHASSHRKLTLRL